MSARKKKKKRKTKKKTLLTRQHRGTEGPFVESGGTSKASAIMLRSMVQARCRRWSALVVCVAVFFATSTPDCEAYVTSGRGLSLPSSASRRMSATRLSALAMGVDAATTSVEAGAGGSGMSGKVLKAAEVLYKFSRPHTIRGTILASAMGVARALREYPMTIDLRLIPRAILGLTALLCGNAYIVGINQIYDVQIDEINKPFLPIAAKKLSVQQAWAIVLGCLATGMAIVKTQFSSLIFGLYMVGAFLGTIYSVPPLQFKRFPLLAGGIIACVRGFLLNFGVYYAVREALDIPFKWNSVVAFISSFMTVFATVIAVTKDLPDVEGDVKYGIKTFASTYGVKAIATGATAALTSTYLLAIALPLLLPGAFNAVPMVVGHSMLMAYHLHSYAQLDPTDMNSIQAFYKAIWNSFYLEYVLYPLI